MNNSNVDELLLQYKEQEIENAPRENIYVAYKKVADYDTCDCAECCCCLYLC